MRLKTVAWRQPRQRVCRTKSNRYFALRRKNIACHLGHTMERCPKPKLCLVEHAGPWAEWCGQDNLDEVPEDATAQEEVLEDMRMLGA
eukprot:1064196-Amphidinium_carterae.1